MGAADAYSLGKFEATRRCLQWVESGHFVYVVTTRRGRSMEFQNQDFTQLVKRTRQKFGVSLDEAHDLIFAEREMRRLIAWRINHDRECRKQALWDIRHQGEQSRFVREGDRIRFRRRDGQRSVHFGSDGNTQD
jgi:hypothetical protein